VSIITGGKTIEGAMPRSHRRTAVFDYDFAVDGGAVGTINMRPYGGTQPQIPAGAIIDRAMLEVLTIPTSGGAPTLACQVEGAGDVQAAAAISGAPWSSLGRKNGTPQAAATSVKTTAARTPALVVATAALTAGVVRLYLDYFDPDAS
jgi:hypothetical protein